MMPADTQIIALGYLFEVRPHASVRSWVARIDRITKADGKGEDDFPDLVRCGMNVEPPYQTL